jgi:hypothetical protein
MSTQLLLRADTTNMIRDVACDVFEDHDHDGHAYDAYKGAEGANFDCNYQAGRCNWGHL